MDRPNWQALAAKAREELVTGIWAQLSGETRGVFVLLVKTGTIHRYALPVRGTDELLGRGIAHVHEGEVRVLVTPPRALYEPRARARVWDDAPWLANERPAVRRRRDVSWQG